MASSGNFCTLNRLVGAASNGRVNSGTMSLGNLKYEDSHSTGDAFVANMAMTGKTYCEVRIDSIGNYGGVIGLRGTGAYSQVYDSITFQTNYSSGLLYHYKGDSDQSASGNIGGTVSAGNILMFAYDPATYKWWVGVNGTWRNSGDPANGSGEVFTGSATMFETMDITWGGWVGDVNGLDTTWNFGQDSTFGGVETAGGNADDNGFGDFKYSPPTGFLALCTGNMSVSDDIDPGGDDGEDENPTKQFGMGLYTGQSGGGNSVVCGFQPDLIWGKMRSGSQTGIIIDSSRGQEILFTAENYAAQTSNGPFISSYNSDGFTFASSGSNPNDNAKTYVAWCWRANGGTTASNSDGSITSTVQANTKAGFSICTYTGNGSNGATFGHGLSAKPSFVIIKNRGSAQKWAVWHQSAGMTDYKLLFLNESSALTTEGTQRWDVSAISNSVFGLGSHNEINGSSETYVSYIWHDVEGYSKFGTYEGNGSTDGTFVYTGFRPRMVFLKQIDGAAEWTVFDTARETHNQMEDLLQWDLSNAETQLTNDKIDFLSNGFKLRGAGGGRTNQSSRTFIYGAWGDVPFKYNNTF